MTETRNIRAVEERAIRVVVTLAVFTTMLALVVVRPRGWNEACWTLLGAGTMLALGPVSPRQALDAKSRERVASLVPHHFELVDRDNRLLAREPTRAEVARAAPRLASFYNEPHNRAMLAHDEELSTADVVAHYRALASERARPFLLEVGGLLVGDADLRRVERAHAEVAILIGERSIQGKGLGTRFGIMLHAFAFRTLGLERLYASIIPANVASLRLFAKLGYEPDDTVTARRHADEADDVTLSLSAERFDELHSALAARVRQEEVL